MSNGETRPDNNGIEQMLARLRANPLVPLLVQQLLQQQRVY